MEKILIYSYHDECSQMEMSWEPKYNRFYVDAVNPFVESHGPEDALYALAILSQGGSLDLEEAITEMVKAHPDAKAYGNDIREKLKGITKDALTEYLAQF